MPEDQATAAMRASSRNVVRPYTSVNRLLTILTVIFVMSSAAGGFGFYVVFNQLHDQARIAFVTTCETDNATRAGALHFIDSQLLRSKASLKATLANPASTPEVKETAKLNLLKLTIIAAEEHRDLPENDCSYPPKTAPTTSPPLLATAPSTTVSPGR